MKRYLRASLSKLKNRKKKTTKYFALGMNHTERRVSDEIRIMADRAFSRAAGAPLIGGNRIRLLRDARENYPAWLDAIAAARHHIHFESYIIYDDETGRRFADALIAKAQEGVRVRLIYDWLGAWGRAPRRFWNHLRAGGVEVRCYNPPRLDSPIGWLSRDHRKMLAVDGEVGFVMGLCIGRQWEGGGRRNLEPWRDTGVEVRGDAVFEIEQAFAQVWAMLGEAIPEEPLKRRNGAPPAGEVNLRVVASVPAMAGMYRLDQLITAMARKRLWLTDAYYGGTAAYVQALRAAARDGVDVRLLVPNGTDIPMLRPLSRTGYRPLLEAGVRIFEWNGTMLHAKTAVADGLWARVGSTNLNIASWLGNCELDIVVEDEAFAQSVEDMFLEDLTNATELVLDAKQKVRAPSQPRRGVRRTMIGSAGQVGRAAAGAVRIGYAVGAAFTDRRILEPMEGRLMAAAGGCFLLLAALFVFQPHILVYPMSLFLIWMGGVLLFKSHRLRKRRNRPGKDVE